MIKNFIKKVNSFLKINSKYYAFVFHINKKFYKINQIKNVSKILSGYLNLLQNLIIYCFKIIKH